MRACEHYVEAERLLGDHDAYGFTSEAEKLATAAVHATLALAGATALQSYARVGDDDGELTDWQIAAGGDG